VDTDLIFFGNKKNLKPGAIPSLLCTSLTVSDLGPKSSNSRRSEIEPVPSTSFDSSVSVAADESSTSNSANSSKNIGEHKKLKVLKRKIRYIFLNFLIFCPI